MEHDPTSKLALTIGKSVTKLVSLIFAVSMGTTAPVNANDYVFQSLVSVQGDISAAVSPRVPSINNLGEVAYQLGVHDPVDRRREERIFVDDGTGPIELVNLTDAGFATAGAVYINDNGAVAFEGIVLVGGPRRDVIIRVEPNGSITQLGEAKTDGTGDFLEFVPQISMNNLGQVAGNARNNDGSLSVLLFDGDGITEIARSSSDLISLSPPDVNDNGVVAFKGQERQPDGSFVSVVLSGTGGPLTTEGTKPGSGGSGASPVINNENLILSDANFPLLFTASGGVVDEVVAGTEDPFFESMQGAGLFSMNNLGDIVFSTSSGDNRTVTGFRGGVFTGNDPVDDLVLAVGDEIFGGTLLGDLGGGGHPIRLGIQSINDSGQLTFLVNTGARNVEDPRFVHVLLATPATTSPGDIDGDDDVDRDDLGVVLSARNEPASGPDDPRDLDGDGVITILDVRQLVLLCTRPRCATE